MPTFTRRSGLLLAIFLPGLVKNKVLRRPSAHCGLGFPHLALDDVDEAASPRLSPCCTAHGWCRGCRFSGTVTPRSWRAGWVMGRAVVGKVLFFFISMLVGPKHFSEVTRLKHKHAAFCSMCFYPTPPASPFFINTCMQLYPFLWFSWLPIFVDERNVKAIYTICCFFPFNS